VDRGGGAGGGQGETRNGEWKTELRTHEGARRNRKRGSSSHRCRHR